jgi:hypothetical protein
MKSDIIEFPDIFHKVCSTFHMTKCQCWDILFLMKEAEIIDIIAIMKFPAPLGVETG